MVNKSTMMPQSPATRPEDLGVMPWYLEENPTVDSSPGPSADRSSYPSYPYPEKEACRPDLGSTRDSSIESEVPRPTVGTLPRKACMDLRDAMALLDETCPNKTEEPSPSLTPRTPRTPLTPYPRNKRARSKSSDNSSNYSNDRLSDRSFEAAKPQEKKRPFLRKIGISKTEDRPLLAKLAPKIIGKPYLEKIGPSKAVEKPFLDKIGSSKTLDKFIFETPRSGRKSAVKNEGRVGRIEKPEEQTVAEKERVEAKPEEKPERRRSGKGFLLKMYSFETEDLESTVQMKERRDSLRGTSMNDVLESGPSSLPPMETSQDQSMKADLDRRPTSAAELLKCRVTTSEEILFSATGLGSPREANSWGNTPRKRKPKRDSSTPKTPTRPIPTEDSREILRNGESTPNSPTKRPISPDREAVSRNATEKTILSPTKTRRQTLEHAQERNGKSEEGRPNKQNQFERRGISSDNLLSKDVPCLASVGHRTINDIVKTRETSSEDSLATRRQEYTKETFKQLQEKFKLQEVPTESYAAFRRRVRGNVHSALERQDRLKVNVTATERVELAKDIAIEVPKPEDETKTKDVASEIVQGQGSTVRSVLRKQERIEQQNDQEADANSSLRRPKRRIVHEPSQETMDLLTELRKVKSLLKTPSWEKDIDLNAKPVRQPKKILLTDKEFCLSVERENSIRRPSRAINLLEKSDEVPTASIQEREDREDTEDKQEVDVPKETLGPALFEKCMSLDYADDEKPQQQDSELVSTTPAKDLPSEAEETANHTDVGLVSDSKSYSADVFKSEETKEKKQCNDTEKESARNRNHYAEVDIAIPIDQKVNSPQGRVQIQGRTSDLYEIISPRSTPFRVKKRLGKISVEETVKPESFTLGSKLDCQSAVTQKRAKCFPL